MFEPLIGLAVGLGLALYLFYADTTRAILTPKQSSAWACLGFPVAVGGNPFVIASAAMQSSLAAIEGSSDGFAALAMTTGQKDQIQ